MYGRAGQARLPGQRSLSRARRGRALKRRLTKWRALLGRRAGEVVKAETPGGVLVLKVVKIEYQTK